MAGVVDPANPFSHFQNTDSYVPMPCATDCTIAIPVYPLHTAYYSVEFLDGGGSVVATSTGLAMENVVVSAPSSGQITFTANPNPITLASGANVGITTLSWNAPGYNALQIRVDGVLFDAELPGNGSVDTGNWVSNGLPFSLVDSTSGQTIATLTVQIATTGSGSRVRFAANPNPITLAAGTNVGTTTLSWNAPENSGLQIWVDGVLFDASTPCERVRCYRQLGQRWNFICAH